MLLLNFTHPLVEVQIRQIEGMACCPVERTLAVMPQFDEGAEFAPQTEALLDGLGLAPEVWQTAAIIVNLPGYAPAAALLLAGLHGRMGYFPTIVRMRPVENSTPRVFEVAELLNLQVARETGRLARRQQSE
jgi:hypothetical protein